jgi:hypothetical protein
VLVILNAASGRPLSASLATADHAAELIPPPQAYESAVAHFRTQGCVAGPLVGASFALTVPANLERRVLGEAVDGGYAKAPLPRPIRRLIAAIVRDRGIDFGPVSYQ